MNMSLGAIESAAEGARPLSAWGLSGGTAPLRGTFALARASERLDHRPASEAWGRALAEAGAARQEPEDFRLGLVYLKSWPDIPGLPEDIAASVTRVCALLSHKPTVGFLVGRVLDLTDDESRRILQVLHRFGHIEVLQRKAGAEGGVEMPPAGESGNAVPPPAQNAFLGRLWKKLTSR